MTEIKTGDRVKITNPISLFCGTEGTVSNTATTTCNIVLDGRENPSFFYKNEVEVL